VSEERREPRTIKVDPAAVIGAHVERLEAEVRALSQQLGLMLLAMSMLAVALGVVLWHVKRV
jgi:hypothetical protein